MTGEAMITTQGLKKLLEDMPDIPVVATWEGILVTLTADKAKIGTVTLPGGDVVECLVLDVDQP